MSGKRIFIIIIYVFSSLQFIRYYVTATAFYLRFPDYLAGHERLPFQERVLPILLIRPIIKSHWVATHLIHENGIFTAPAKGAFYVISFIAFVVAAIFTQKLYNAVSQTRSLEFLVYPLFLFAAMWSYTIHIEANFSYPYDMMAVAFFCAGLYFIYTRKFPLLAVVMLIGTINRETTLFLVGIFLIDAASLSDVAPNASIKERFSLAKVPWGRVALLTACWLVVKLTLSHIFKHNDASENYVRIGENLIRLRPRLWPSLLNICGYLLPIVLVLRQGIQPVRFANYLYIVPFWFAVMFYTGVIVETRIYGELCSFVAVAMVLILEQYVATLPRETRLVVPATPVQRAA